MVGSGERWQGSGSSAVGSVAHKRNTRLRILSCYTETQTVECCVYAQHSVSELDKIPLRIDDTRWKVTSLTQSL